MMANMLMAGNADMMANMPPEAMVADMMANMPPCRWRVIQMMANMPPEAMAGMDADMIDVPQKLMAGWPRNGTKYASRS